MEKINLTNPDVSQEDLERYTELASKLKSLAPNNVTVGKLIKSLNLGYYDAAKNYFQGNLDKFISVPEEALRVIREEFE